MEEKSFVTAHNVSIEYELSGVSERILAYLLDYLIMGSFAFLFFLLFAAIDPILSENPFTLFFLLSPFLFYHIGFEIALNGQTPGKKALKIKVIKDDGTQATLSNYLLRWIFRPVDFLLSGSVATVMIIITKKHQRLGDLAAGTLVVKVDSHNSFIKRHSMNLVKDDYIPTFEEAARLDPDHIEIIRKAIKVYSTTYNVAPVVKVAEITKEKMDVQTDLVDLKFLYTVLKDYDYYNSQDLFTADI